MSRTRAASQFRFALPLRIFVPLSNLPLVCMPLRRLWKIACGSRLRGQADVCHAYHLVRRNGIPEERVILMSYGDAADSVDNPIRGTLYK